MVIFCLNYLFGCFYVYCEIVNIFDFDVVIYFGDYIYEYGVDGYGGIVG